MHAKSAGFHRYIVSRSIQSSVWGLRDVVNIVPLARCGGLCLDWFLLFSTQVLVGSSCGRLLWWNRNKYHRPAHCANQRHGCRVCMHEHCLWIRHMLTVLVWFFSFIFFDATNNCGTSYDPQVLPGQAGLFLDRLVAAHQAGTTSLGAAFWAGTQDGGPCAGTGADDVPNYIWNT